MTTFKNTHHVPAWLAIAALSVALAACGGGGSSGSATPPVSGAVNIAPVASIAASLTTPVVGQSVSFSPTASYDVDGSIVNYQWDFGDGQTQLIPSNALVNHVYTSVGSYTATLSVFDSGGKTNSIGLPIQVGLVPNIAPVASFTANNLTPMIGQAIIFNPVASSDLDGTIVSYDWDFGDGITQTNLTNAAAAHSFSGVGTYSVRLTVTDNRGGIQYVTRSIVVSLLPNVTPVAGFSVSITTPVVNQVVSFNPAASTDSDGTIVSYSWNFGDGSVLTNLTNAMLNHSFAQVGNYTVGLTVVDNRSGSHSVFQTIYVGRVLNDTGQYSCYDALGTILSSCTGTGADGEFGLDSNAATNSNSNGALGFNFTKLDSLGNVLVASANSWDCVLDNVTGLIWENKNILNTHLQYSSHTYTWYSTDTASNGGHVGTTGTNTCNSTLTTNLCNSQGYANRVNAVGLCGKNDWRISSAAELMTLVNWGATSTPRVDLTYFPNQQAGLYWTGTSNPINVLDAYLFSFSTGTLATSAKTMPAYVQLVRGMP